MGEPAIRLAEPGFVEIDATIGDVTLVRNIGVVLLSVKSVAAPGGPRAAGTGPPLPSVRKRGRKKLCRQA